MNPEDGQQDVLGSLLADWTPDPWIYVAAAIAALFYLRGWWILNRRVPDRFGPGRLVAFLAGLGTILLAIGSPVDAFADLLLQAHMAQHWLLVMVAPPLLWLAAPQIAILRGLPSSWRKQGLGPFLAWPALQRLGRFLAHPITAWVVFVVTTWTWHAPSLYEAALSSDAWHQFEHVCFLVSALLFWWPVVQPWPSHAVWPRWAMIPYLLLAALQNTVFSALFAFSSQPFYPRYTAAPRIFDVSALADQTAAGAFIWVASALVLLPAAIFLAVQWLSPQPVATLARKRPPPRALHRIDLLRVRGLGTLLRSRAARRALQTACFGLAALVILDGWWGPQTPSATNLAGVLPWTYWRGGVVVGLFFVGSLFCMACPFTLPRGLAKRLLGARVAWPRSLRNKWFAVALMIGYFASLETLGIWSSPWLTAWLIAGYFVAAFAVDGIFRGASFCKYVCPAGQFQFTLASISSLDIQARDPHTCQTCRTKDCLRGNANASGCPTDLLVATKRGHWDCTLCMDCVRACPHDNIGLVSTVPGRDLATDPLRSSLGHLSNRPDVAALACVLVFAAFANAAAMTAPVVAGVDRIGVALGSFAIASGLLVGLSITLVPAVLVAIASFSTRALAGVRAPVRGIAARFSLALLPLGMSMFLAHYGLHLYAGLGSAGPAFTRAAQDAGLASTGLVEFQNAMAQGGMQGLRGLEVALLGFGLLLSLYVSWRIALQYAPRDAIAARMVLPFGALQILLYAWGVWIFCQPMMMRGTLL